MARIYIAFIEMDDARDADDAVRALDGFKGWRVEISRNRGPPPGRGGFRGGPPVDRFDDFRRSPPRRRSPSPYRRPKPRTTALAEPHPPAVPEPDPPSQPKSAAPVFPAPGQPALRSSSS
ncbi:hypothetical protein VOLCADRAFT_89297 [Volvox carteri f. nagariensis]|uniref:RRM domain-containing protein n=1 Tax=Volvox carteri f. nagariensis TaxID=3068 RepID=D8TRC1_VOLCA|nr:uncharacterized protein VOLCADRAFT_89297 [Volvox carteri f. nagariensis]EFJ49969.1 hypothetical protein VOLCADRAFT_89297 [Volvox carteri f. nagariensis]|eukprot:XP_002949034.1 hypothetical protein VOLCADRAFT_89297 [Volvox carteri f. nagariensis]